MKKNGISVVIPTLNEQANIRRCLDSIFRQNYSGPLEVIIVDGGSTDETLQIAKKYPVKILKNRFKQAEYGKKIGFDKANGEYFMILDCDMDLVGDRWFDRLVEPLERDNNLTGSWVQFVSSTNDAPLNKFITLDPIQRDPLFEFLTPTINSCVVKKNSNYWTTKYTKGKILPASFCLYRKKDLLATPVKQMKKYMELDTLSIFVGSGKNLFAYVQHIGIHHPFLTTLSNLMRKRIRNLETMYFNQPDMRYWTWIDWNDGKDILKIFIWLLYCYTVIPSVIIGVYKCIRYRTWVGFYELPFNILTTNVIVKTFLEQNEGRNMVVKIFSRTS